MAPVRPISEHVFSDRRLRRKRQRARAFDFLVWKVAPCALVGVLSALMIWVAFRALPPDRSQLERIQPEALDAADRPPPASVLPTQPPAPRSGPNRAARRRAAPVSAAAEAHPEADRRFAGIEVLNDEELGALSQAR